MVLTPSTMQLSISAAAPDFSLPDPDGKVHSLDDFAGRPALLVAFICNHCPYVKHVAPAFAKLAKEYQEKGVGVVAINANDFEHYLDDSPAKMKEEIAAQGYTFPYLVDQLQQVAKAYRAACTPDFYLFDADRKLVYRGQMDASSSGQQPARHRQGPPRGDRRRLGRPPRSEGPAAQHRLQHQVAAGQFA